VIQCQWRVATLSHLFIMCRPVANQQSEGGGERGHSCEACSWRVGVNVPCLFHVLPELIRYLCPEPLVELGNFSWRAKSSDQRRHRRMRQTELNRGGRQRHIKLGAHSLHRSYTFELGLCCGAIVAHSVGCRAPHKDTSCGEHEKQRSAEEHPRQWVAKYMCWGGL
jgi:hypothetical protein